MHTMLPVPLLSIEGAQAHICDCAVHIRGIQEVVLSLPARPKQQR